MLTRLLPTITNWAIGWTKTISWSKSTCFNFFSSNFIVWDHILNTTRDVMKVLTYISNLINVQIFMQIFKLLSLLSFILLLTIFFSWLLWSSLSSFTNVQIGCLLVYFLGFFPLVNHYCPLNDIRVLGNLFGFVFFFTKDVLKEDVRHVKVFLKLVDVQVVFGILFWCFAWKPSYLFYCFPPLSIFQCQLVEPLIWPSCKLLGNYGAQAF